MPSSGIERLPVELLQPIFFSSGYNIALLKASPSIGVRLSSDYVYHAVCNHYLKDSVLDRTAQTAAQTYIFATKWMTWPFFMSWVMKTYASIGCLCGTTEEEGCFDAQWPPNFGNATSMVFSRSHLPQFAFIKARLPKKLLCGPWTPDKVRFLQFLLWITSMTVEWSDTETRQIALEGRRQAMRERNLDAVELFNHNRRLGRGADLSTVRFAVVECGCDRSIVYDTISMARLWGCVASWDYTKLDEWCEERIVMGDPKGLWLQTKLMELRRIGRPAEDGKAGLSCLKGSLVNRLVDEPEDYDGGPHDQFIRRQHKWNQEIRQFGWFYQPQAQRPKQGLHFLKREDVGAYWEWSHGTHHVMKGTCNTVGYVRNMWLEMWIPDSDCQGIGTCSCVEDEDDA